jgi:hypothetical protein
MTRIRRARDDFTAVSRDARTNERRIFAPHMRARAHPPSTRAARAFSSSRRSRDTTARARRATPTTARRTNARACVAHERARRVTFGLRVARARSCVRASDGDDDAGTAAATARRAETPNVLETALVVVFSMTYAAITMSSAVNAFMWMLDFTNPIIQWTSVGTVIGRACVASGVTALAALDFGPRACEQMRRCARTFATKGSSERLKADAAKFAALVGMKVACEAYAYWKALTSFSPCSQSLELCAWYGVAFLGHAAFIALAKTQINEDGSFTEEIPAETRKLIVAFNLGLAALCAATSAFAARGFGGASATCGVVFFAAAIFFTFEHTIAPIVKKAFVRGDASNASSA